MSSYPLLVPNFYGQVGEKRQPLKGDAMMLCEVRSEERKHRLVDEPVD
jgi:hypothetical protein